ncbi:alanine racemase [Desulfovibrio sp.]|uniref:alanine racemase n=1 Tax=Desulfovibrio sp. TaxID=885 RepID=UPI0023BBDC02|nr:alanine racemase [Desulfovibrio sp.]MDE7242179.1 alanine racemase [Desulfovibrio sp.]
MHIRCLSTPALLLDDERLARNIRRLAARLAPFGVGFRLHAKTLKCVEVARRAMTTPGGPVAVSTLAEAEWFAERGVLDICYAVGIAPGKFERALALRERGVALTLLLDSVEAARALAEFGAARGHVFEALLEVDCDGHRAGLAPADPDLVAAANLLRARGQRVTGVLTHAGSAYDLGEPSPQAFAALAGQERAAVVAAAEALRAAGHACPVVSVGSTPTALFGEDFSGVTEVRAGVYLTQDLVMAGLGVCHVDDIALSVLCTVIGRRGSDGALVTDAGWTALSRDAGLKGRFAEFGYGLVQDENGNLLAGLRVNETNQEHGLITGAPGKAVPALPVGTRLRVVPVHACATASGFETVHLCQGAEEKASWPRCRGW